MSIILNSLSDIVDKFDVFLFDAWGVLHDGEKAYPYVLKTLAKLREQGKKTIVVSNSPRSQHSVMESLLKSGIPKDAYDFLHCSGQEGIYLFQEQHSFGTHCFHLGDVGHRAMFDHVPLVRVDDLSRADFILNTGFLMDDGGKSDIDQLLIQEASRTRPKKMVCLNPDVFVYIGGKKMLCAGYYAQNYRDLGGEVYYVGKPYPDIYRRALSLMGIDPAARKLIIGDSFETDMLGSQKLGIPGVLTLTGLHHHQLVEQLVEGDRLNQNALQNLVAQHGVEPTYIIDQVRF